MFLLPWRNPGEYWNLMENQGCRLVIMGNPKSELEYVILIGPGAGEWIPVRLY